MNFRLIFQKHKPSLFLLLSFIFCSISVFTISCLSDTKTLLRSPTISTAEGNTWAIIVGAGDNTSYDINVRYANNDAIGLCAVLKPIFGENHIKLLVGANATKSKLQDSILDWLLPREHGEDTVFFFLAGHGSTDSFQLNGPHLNAPETHLTPQVLSTWISILNSKNIVIVMDFCESGNYGATISNTQGITISSCTDREKCWQEKSYEHGIYSYYLIKAFGTPDIVDNNHDNKVSAEELFEYSKLEVVHEFQSYPPPSPQHPCIIDNYPGELTIFTYR